MTDNFSSTFSILVVDDEPDNFDVIETLLSEQISEQNYVLHYAPSGEVAIASLEIFQPDVILLDVMMPVMDGLEVCQRIKTMPPWQAVPIIMVTALTTKEDLSRCLQVGADDFISKPVSGLELRARVKSMLRIKKQYDQVKNLAKLQENTIDLLQNNLDELCGNLVSTLPHEINTPLNGVFGVIDILIDDHQNMSAEEIHEFLVMAQESAHKLEKLTRRFLQYAQLEVRSNKPKTIDKQILAKASTEILMTNAIKDKAERINRSDDLIIDLENLEIAITDQDLLCIVEELLENAFKFSEPGTPVHLSGHLKKGKFHLSISDQGRGMTTEQISKIGAFAQFERNYYEHQGIGLGLKIVKKMTELYGGKFLVSSAYHQGTLVCVELPTLEY